VIALVLLLLVLLMLLMDARVARWLKNKSSDPKSDSNKQSVSRLPRRKRNSPIFKVLGKREKLFASGREAGKSSGSPPNP